MDIISYAAAKSAGKKHRELDELVDYTPTPPDMETIRDKVDAVEREVDKVTYYRDQIKTKTYLAQLERKKIRETHGLAIEQGLHYLNFDDFSDNSKVDIPNSKNTIHSTIDKMIVISEQGYLQTRFYLASELPKEMYVDFDFLQGEENARIEVELHTFNGLVKTISIQNKTLLRLESFDNARRILIRLHNDFVPEEPEDEDEEEEEVKEEVLKISSMSLIWK